jgi:PHD/YefM family antitoxin component YafN of YafNO toxin-antitoxin module
MMRKIPIGEAAEEITNLATKLPKKREVVALTRNGRPVLALMSWERYESIMETLDIMSDQDLMAALRLSAQQVADGRTVPWEHVKRDWSV